VKPGDRQTFVVPIRSVREEASDLLRVMEIGPPDVVIRARERLKAALSAESVSVVERSEGFVEYVQLRCPKCENVRDNPRATLQNERGSFRNIVNAIGESTCDSCRPSAEVTQAVDEIVDRSDAAGLGAFVPKSYREERAARTGTVPLLEYLDKLESAARAASDGRWAEVNDWNSSRPDAWGDTVHVQIATVGDDEHENADANRAHILATQPRATLALIHSTRVLVLTIRKFCENHRIDTSDPEISHIFEIEVPS